MHYSASASGENVVSGAEQHATAGEREEEKGSAAAILDTGKESALSEGKKSSSSVAMESARKSAILERGRGSAVLEGSSVVIEGGTRGTPTATEGQGEGKTSTTDVQTASGGEVEVGEGTTHQNQRESCKEEGAKVKQRKKKYIFKGGANALAVQLFGINEKFEMRSVVTVHLDHYATLIMTIILLQVN